ncbi:nucleoside diphosphate kinase [Syncephalastrum racemosum]|uniref:Nucleoside diphosphate kinase n=1 Tax=Syncephalastrum racemosum TaxID=13706 RepID=A0A1X2H4V8_SYNRA|nr:nucleoside diphosphate kinase [Syncephalastrum racemosum]
MSDKEVQVAEQAAPEIQLPLQRTLALIKPDAVKSGKQQPIIDAIRLAGFHIADERSLTLSLEEARLFYREHEGKPFYTELTEWMSGGPIYAMVLEKANAIQDWRALMGPTDPARARETEPNSIRARFGADARMTRRPPACSRTTKPLKLLQSIMKAL